MKRRRAMPADIAFAQHRAAAKPITLPTHWSPEQAVAVFEILDELREQVWARYGLQIQQALRDECDTADPAAGGMEIDDADVPF
jgi:hypothetical protein